MAAYFCSAQLHSVAGSVSDAGNRPVRAAAVSILSAGDSAWISSQLSDDSGTFSFKELQAGDYILSVQALGFKTKYSILSLNKDIAGLPIALSALSNQLNDVTVSSQRSFIEPGLGKTVINVEKSISSTGSNVWELLRKSPGVTVSDEGGISMQGKQGVVVLVDDRPTYLSGSQLMQYLKSMPATDIAQLELITQPSARYDAEGNSGIVNIKTKRIKKRGFNGSVSGTYAQSRYPSAFESLQLNYRKNKISIYANFSYYYGRGYMTQDLHRNFRNINTYAISGTFDQNLYSYETFTNTGIKLGGDLAATEKTNIGINLSGDYHPNNEGNRSHARTYDAATDVASYNYSQNKTDWLRKNGTITAYLRHKFAKENELSINADYLNYWVHSFQNSVNTNQAEGGGDLPSLLLRGQLPSYIKVYSLKADHSVMLGKIKLESGLKSSYVKTDNQAIYEVSAGNDWAYDTTRSNHFLYNENINAAYLSASRALGSKWQLQLGLRAENTNAEGTQTVHRQSFTRHYLSLFPTAYTTYQADSNNQFELNYGRRIERPDYSSLNPFITFLSQYNYMVGNPDLLPEYSHSIELKHSFKNKLFTTLNYRHTTGIREHVLTQNDTTKVVYSKPQNFAGNDNIGLSILYTTQLYKWWTASFLVYGVYIHYTGMLNRKPIDIQGTGHGFNLNNQFSFAKKWSAECELDYAGPSRESLLRAVGEWWYLSAGISRKVLKDAGSIKLGIQDPFHAYNYNVHIRLNDLDTRAHIKYNTCQYAVSFTYNFGKQIDNIRKAQSGIGDESKRIKM